MQRTTSHLHAPVLAGIVALEVLLPERFFSPSRFLVLAFLIPLTLLLVAPLRRLRPSGGAVLGAAAVVAALAVNYGVALQRHQALLTASLLFLYLVVYLSARRGLTGEHADRVIAAVVGIGVLCCLWAAYQSLFGFREALVLLEQVEMPGEELFAARLATGRVFGTFILPSAFGAFLIVLLPATAWLAARPGRPAGRLAAGAAVLLEGWALFRTRSHGAALALVVALVLVAAVRASRRRRAGLLAAAALVAVLLGAVVLSRGGVLLRPSDPGGPIGQRLGVWKSAAEMVADRPLFGAGGGGFGVAFPAYRKGPIHETRYVHNTYLQLAAEYGVWVFAPLALFLHRFFRRLRHPAVDAGDRSFFLSIGCTAFVIHNAVDFGFYLPAAAVPFFLLLGIRDGGGPDPGAANGFPAARLAAGLLPAVALGFTVFWGLLWLSDREIDAAGAALADGGPAAALGRLERSIALFPSRPEGWGFLAEVRFAAAGSDREELERAREEALRAVALDPHTPFRHHLAGRISFALGDDGAALLSMRRATRLYPVKEEYRQGLAAVEERIGRRDEPQR